MTTVAPEPKTAPPTQGPPAALSFAPRIVANRKLLVSRFPSLAFTLSSGGLPYWEVLLCTDRSLLDPGQAGRRTPSNFYASRQDGGLRKAGSSGQDVFLVPSAVLRGFAAATPKPTAIYYTVACYPAADGGTPTFPGPAAQLAIDAPRVDLAADFTADTVDRALGVRADRLRVLAHSESAPAPAPVTTSPSAPAAAPTTSSAPPPAPGIAPTTTATGSVPAPSAQPAAPPSTPPDAVTDRAEGEDGYSYLVSHGEHAESGHGAQWSGGDQSYDDGYGPYQPSGAQEQAWGEAEDAAYPPGFPEPAPLGNHDSEVEWSTSAPAPELSGVSTRHPYHGLDDPAPTSELRVATAPSPAPQPALDGTAPPPSSQPAAAAVAPRPLKLTIEQKRAVIERIAGAESSPERYGAINADGEYRGRFGSDHPAYHHHHIGLSYGLIQFTQESGNLGRLLVMMRDRDEATFRHIFGEHADELITVTMAAGTSSRGSADGRSARTQPVDGHDLWEEPWVSRFRQAGDVVAFQAAQNELAASTFLDPMVGFAGDFGLDTDRALTIVVDRAVQMGVTGAQQWIAAAVGPISTPALRQQALSALGYADIASFQRAWGLGADGIWGPLTHAGLVGALRQLGSGSPIPLPTLEQMLDAIVRRAEADQAFWVGRVRRLRTAGDFSDHPFPH